MSPGPREKFLPVFTDLDTAERFIADRPLPGHHPSDVATRDFLRVVLDAAGKAGVGYVALDPAATGTRQAVTFPLEHFRRCLRPADAG